MQNAYIMFFFFLLETDNECCPQMQRAVNHGDFMQQLSQQEAVLLSVVACICHDDMSVASSAVSLLVRLGASSAGLSVLYSAPMVQALKGVMMQRDIIRFRVYEVMACMSGPHSDLVFVFVTKISSYQSCGKSLECINR
jgi:hypothetical protein